MKNTVYIFAVIACLLTGGSLYAQNMELDQLAGKIIELCEDSENWNYSILDDSIVVEYKSQFTINTIYGPREVSKKELKKPGSNSLVITFKSLPNWTDSVYFETKENNNTNLIFLKEEFIAYHKSAGWPKKFPTSKFNERPMEFISRFEHKTDSIFNNIKRLPDFRIGTYGVFYDSSIDFSGFYVVQPDVREEIEYFIVELAKLDRYFENAIDFEQSY